MAGVGKVSSEIKNQVKDNGPIMLVGDAFGDHCFQGRVETF